MDVSVLSLITFCFKLNETFATPSDDKKKDPDWKSQWEKKKGNQF